MAIGNRSFRKILAAPFQRRHYVALINMMRVYPAFFDNLWRYFTARGDYPHTLTVRTPCGPIPITLYSHHDLLTVNEIFCRQDYAADEQLEYVLDLGSNIGISATYFLTRNTRSQCILYEPDPRNVARLEQALQPWRSRYTLVQAAVAAQAGEFDFGVESSGRYGGLGVVTGQSIRVRCDEINAVIEHALRSFPRIDILKIDTEGVEIETVEAIRPDLAARIRCIYIEAAPQARLHPQRFEQHQYGTVCQLRARP